MTAPWTPIALSGDLPALAVMPTVADGRDIVLWRSATGKLRAWTDRCPHRGMRLSHGFVRGEALSCIYHGWSYGAAGSCLRIPAHPDLEPPEAIRVTAFAVAETGGLIWVAPDAAPAPPPDPAMPVALRSLTVEAPSLPGLEADADGFLRGRLGGVGLALAVQPLRDGRIALHALADTPDPEALVAASRALEDLRRRAEETA